MSTVARRNAADRTHSRHVSGSSILSSPNYNGRSSYESQARTSFESRGSLESARPHDVSLQRFVLTDPIALRYLEDDLSVTVVERHARITGYECYVVEQWCTARVHPTFAITNYTGDHNDIVAASVVEIPLDEPAWSPGLRAYFKALNRYHARRRDTSNGFIMTISMSAFPSSLTLIRIPDGDLSACRIELLVNENLKRLGCSGRTGFAFVKSNAATVAKYHQLYRTSEKCSFNDSVIELVKMCQTALHLFDALAIECVDGLLCDLTERAISEWWSSIGSEVYAEEPRDGILGPTTVAAILGCLLGARNRLHALGISVPKDPFDMEEMKRGVSRFQKYQRILRTRRLDRQTMLRLHKASDKAARAEGWSVPKAVKSTVAELSGKGGEMLAEVVGRRDRAGIADVETTSIEVFYNHVFGDRCKWLWNGKPLKNIAMGEATIEGRLILKDDRRTFTWTALKVTPVQSSAVQGSKAFALHKQLMLDGHKPDQDERAFRGVGVRKKATDLLHEGRNNFDRLRDVVNLRGHQPRHSTDYAPLTPPRPGSAIDDANSARPAVQRAYTSPSAESSPVKASQWLNQALRRGETSHSNASYVSTIFGAKSQQLEPMAPHSRTDPSLSNHVVMPLSRPVSMSYDDLAYLDNALPQNTMEQAGRQAGPLLQRTVSLGTLDDQQLIMHRPGLPRYLSYNVADDTEVAPLLTDDDFTKLTPTDLDRQMLLEQLYISQLQTLRSDMARISSQEQNWAHHHLADLDALTSRTAEHLAYVSETQQTPATQLTELKERCAVSVREQKEVLGEMAQEIETLASRLDYEIASLQGRVEDVEVGLEDFEKGVESVERAAAELEGRGHGGWGCIVM